MTPINIVNVSGGVDSTACYLLALEEREKTGQDFRAVFADTGNEHQITLDYINSLAEKTGGPKIQTAKADFTQRIAARRIKLEMMLETKGFKGGLERGKREARAGESASDWRAVSGFVHVERTIPQHESEILHG